jgi:hypothetical protein
VNQHLGRDGNVLGVSTAVGKTENFVADLEVFVSIRTEALDDTGELNAHGRGCLRGKRVETLPLQQVHAVQAEGPDLDDCISFFRSGLGNLINEEIRGGAFAAFDACETSVCFFFQPILHDMIEFLRDFW